MSLDTNDLTVTNNTTEGRFEANVDQHLAVMAYELAGNRIIFTHTEVPEALRGRGIAEKMARNALDHARTQHLTVVPLCRFVKGYIERHPEYQDLVAA